jgi:hypothetical protein
VSFTHTTVNGIDVRILVVAFITKNEYRGYIMTNMMRQENVWMFGRFLLLMFPPAHVAPRQIPELSICIVPQDF